VIDKGPPRRDIAPVFVDYVEIEVKAGNGGAGCVSFHTEKYMPRGGPDGGDGGRGGSVKVAADPNLTTLLDYRYRRTYKATNGRPGEGNMRSGKSGEDVILRLPVGTLIKDLETGQNLADLDEVGAIEVIARGGRGGKGNTHFKSATKQTPRFAQPGEPGQTLRVSLELKLLADVGLVGKPNAGKSTILASFSAARPKIADYPFTTLSPNLGIVKLREYKSCVMADIPGLIAGAAQGKGLGHQFLKHIQRTRLLVYVVDVAEPDIVAAEQELRSELASFDNTLPAKPSLKVVTKIDTVADSDLAALRNQLGDNWLYLSSVSRLGAQNFLNRIEQELDRQRTERAAD